MRGGVAVDAGYLSGKVGDGFSDRPSTIKEDRAMLQHVDDMVIFCSPRMRNFTEEVCTYLQLLTEDTSVKVGEASVGEHPDGEPDIDLMAQMRDRRVYLIVSTFSASSLVKLVAMADAARRASAHQIIAVMPYFGYARQDRKDRPHAAITAKAVMNCLVSNGVGGILTMDLHAPQIQGFADIPVNHLYGSLVLIPRIEAENIQNLTVVAPDIGAVKRCRAYATLLSRGGVNVNLAIIDKRRGNDGTPETMNIIGELTENCLLADDLLSTGLTLCRGAEALRDRGVKKVYAALAHGVFCRNRLHPEKDSLRNLEEAGFARVWVTNSIPWRQEEPIPTYLEYVSAAEKFADAIRRIHYSLPLSSLFKEHTPR